MLVKQKPANLIPWISSQKNKVFKKISYLHRFMKLDERKKKMLVGGFIAFIMIASVFVVTLDYVFSSPNNLVYNDFVFRAGNNEWLAELNGKEKSFIFFPGDLEYIELSPEAKEILSAPVLTVTYDASSELTSALATAQFYIEGQIKDVKIIDRAVLNNSGLSLEEKSCLNATVSQPVIELRSGNSSLFSQKDSCIRIEGIDSADILRFSERIIYHILGVMK